MSRSAREPPDREREAEQEDPAHKRDEKGRQFCVDGALADVAGGGANLFREPDKGDGDEEDGAPLERGDGDLAWGKVLGKEGEDHGGGVCEGDEEAEDSLDESPHRRVLMWKKKPCA